MAEPREFRWQFADDGVGEQWTDWHVVADRCPTCCGGGPVEGEHQSPAAFYDEDGVDWNCHTHYDPASPDFPAAVEWREPSIPG